MKEDYATRMANDLCFADIDLGYERWCKGKSPGVDGVVTAVILGTGVAVLLLSWASRDLILAGSTVIGCIILYAAVYRTEWPPLLDIYLNKYAPVDAAAFSIFQEKVLQTGELQQEALGRWIEVERNARRLRHKSGLAFARRDTNAHKN